MALEGIAGGPLPLLTICICLSIHFSSLPNLLSLHSLPNSCLKLTRGLDYLTLRGELLLLHSFEVWKLTQNTSIYSRSTNGGKVKEKAKQLCFLTKNSEESFVWCVGYKRFLYSSRKCRESQSSSLHPLPSYPETFFTDDISELRCRWCLWEVKLGEKRDLLPMKTQMRAALMPWWLTRVLKSFGHWILSFLYLKNW